MGHVLTFIYNSFKNKLYSKSFYFLLQSSSNQGFQCLENSTFRRADGFIIVYDVTNENSFNNIRNWVRHINETCDQRMPILIVGNKTDLRETATCNRLKFIDTRKGSLTARVNHYN
jgi:GTPase SAR1 family protein